MLHRTLRERGRTLFMAVALAAVITLPGCGTAPAGGGQDITLSSAKLVPGEFLTISHGSIAAGSTVTVEFRGTDGFVVSVEAFDTEDGRVRVSVPPFIDLATGAFGAGEVTVSIGGVNSERLLVIEDLLELGALAPGSVLRLVLEGAIEDYQSLSSSLTRLAVESGGAVDSSESVAAIGVAIESLQSQLAELDATGQLVVTLPDGATATLGAEKLAVADRLLATLFAGVGNAGSVTSKRAGSLTRKDVAECLRLTGDADAKVECLKEVLADIRAATGQGTNLASMVGTGVGVLITLSGIVFGPEVALTGVIVAVISAATSFGNAAVNNQNTDAFINNDRAGFSASQESASQFVRVGTSAASNLPGPIGLTTTAVNVGLSAADIINGAEGVKCSGTQKGFTNQQVAADVADFCPVISPPPGDGPGSDPGTNGGLTLLGFSNTDGFLGTGPSIDPSQAQIRLSGDVSRPTISWTDVSNVFTLFVTRSTLDGSLSVLYGLEGETPPDENGDTEQAALGFSSVTYGTYGLANTVPLGGLSGPLGPADAIPLTSGMFVSVSLATLTGELATLTFQVN